MPQKFKKKMYAAKIEQRNGEAANKDIKTMCYFTIKNLKSKWALRTQFFNRNYSYVLRPACDSIV